MSDDQFSVIIVGGGPVGCALALLLARHAPDPARIALVQNRPRDSQSATTSCAQPEAPTSLQPVTPASPQSPPPVSPQFGPPTLTQVSPLPHAHRDARVIALNHGSLVLLETLGIHLTPSTPIHHIHVSQPGGLGHTVIHATDFDVPQLSRVARYTTIKNTLEASLASCGVRLISPHPAQVAPHHKTQDDIPRTRHGNPSSHPQAIRQDNQQVWVSTAHSQPLRCAVAVIADGTSSHALERDYSQHAVLTMVQATQPRRGWAFERFTRSGPLALLPHPDAEDCYAVVWCCAPKDAQELATTDSTTFSQALARTFGERLGRLSCIGPRHVSPLYMRRRHHPLEGRVVAIGNAAQTLHPVAGQGLNLGLRDAARLAQALTPWLSHPDDDPRLVLHDYAQARRGDRWLTTTITDILPRIFTRHLTPVTQICGGALLGLNLFPFLRAPLARHLLQGWRS